MADAVVSSHQSVHLSEKLVRQESGIIASSTPQSFSDRGEAPQNVLLVSLVREKSHASFNHTRAMLLNFVGVETRCDPLHNAKRGAGDVRRKEGRQSFQE